MQCGKISNKGMANMAEKDDRSAATAEPVVIKKYANRRLYNTESSSYVTLDDLAKMVRSDRDFIVRDAKSGDDLTHAVLTQIIVEQEAKAGGQTLLPTPFLRQLIRYYDDSIGKMVPSYLQFSMAALEKEQQRCKSQFANWGPNTFDAYQEQARKNLAMFEQAFSIWSPIVEAGGEMPDQAAASQDAPANGGAAMQSQPPQSAVEQATEPTPSETAQQPEKMSEIEELKAELEAMQAKIERISRSS